MLLPLGAHVNTNVGEGFLVGRNISRQPLYSVILFNGELRHSMPSEAQADKPLVTTVELIDPLPVRHPWAPPGLRKYIEQRA